jgi:hypothetical protein
MSKTQSQPEPLTNDEIKIARQTLATCLNHWKQQIDSGTLAAEEKARLVTNCFIAARLLLLSMGPNPNGDAEFVKMLLLLRMTAGKE